MLFSANALLARDVSIFLYRYTIQQPKPSVFPSKSYIMIAKLSEILYKEILQAQLFVSTYALHNRTFMQPQVPKGRLRLLVYK